MPNRKSANTCKCAFSLQNQVDSPHAALLVMNGFPHARSPAAALPCPAFLPWALGQKPLEAPQKILTWHQAQRSRPALAPGPAQRPEKASGRSWLAVAQTRWPGRLLPFDLHIIRKLGCANVPSYALSCNSQGKPCGAKSPALPNPTSPVCWVSPAPLSWGSEGRGAPPGGQGERLSPGPGICEQEGRPLRFQRLPESTGSNTGTPHGKSRGLGVKTPGVSHLRL